MDPETRTDSDAQRWATTVDVDEELDRDVLVAIARFSVDGLAHFDVDQFAGFRQGLDREQVCTAIDRLEARGLIEYTLAYQPFDAWRLNR